MLPLKYSKHWKWENTWLLFSGLSLVIIPWLLAAFTIPNWPGIYTTIDPAQLGVCFLFGAGWGIAQVMFGLSVVRLGVALAYAIVIGLGALLGTLTPLLLKHREAIRGPNGGLILGGIALMVGGIVACCVAGRDRERSLARGTARTRRNGYVMGLTIALIAGFLAPMLNYSLAFGEGIRDAALRSGSTAANASYCVWPIALAGGLVANAGYSIYLLNRHKSWIRFRTSTTDALLSVLMAVLWMGAVAVYGMGASYLGRLGTSIGWALFQIFMIGTANMSGVFTGEWKGAGHKANITLGAGLVMLAIATSVIAYANR